MIKRFWNFLTRPNPDADFLPCGNECDVSIFTDPYPAELMKDHLDLGSDSPQADPWDAPVWGLEK